MKKSNIVSYAAGAALVMVLIALGTGMVPAGLMLPTALTGTVLFLGHSITRGQSSLLSGSSRSEWKISADWLLDAIIVTDLKGNLSGLNSACREMLDVPASANAVQELMEPLHAMMFERGHADDVLAAVIASPEIKFSETLTLKDGRIIERTTRPIAGTDERIWILSDVTQTVLADNDSAMHKQMLEEDAARTAELAEQLYHAKAELESKQSELTWLANTDPMTGLLNRRRFFAQADEAIKGSAFDGSLWVLMMDIDHFKSINDTFGHAAGDIAIRNFAKVTTTVAGERGFVGRMGGEEFAIILSNSSSDDAFRIAERIRRDTTRTETVCDAEKFRFTTSIGVASWHKGETSIEPALDRADKALYTAKSYGRNRVVGYE